MIQSYLYDKEPTRRANGIAFVDMPFSIASMGTRRVILTERYPEVGYDLLASDMIVTVLAGSVFLYLENDVSETFSKGDTVCVPQGTKHYWIRDSRIAIMQATSTLQR